MKLFQKHFKITLSTCAKILCKIKLHKLEKPRYMYIDTTSLMRSMRMYIKLLFLNTSENQNCHVINL